MKKLLLLITLTLVAASAARAQSIPTIVSYQGYITSQGVPVNGSITISLALFNASTGGTSVWSLPSESITASNGYYTVLMDFSQNWQNGSADFHGQYWLQPTVNGDIMGRIQMVGSPFAINAILADSAIRIPQAPIGTIVAYAGQALGLPTEKASGWYICDGSLVSTTDFPLYASAIGSIYGTNAAGDSVYLPDFRGLFLRGVSGTRSDSLADPDASSRFALNGRGLAGNQVGSIQQDTLGSHTHGQTWQIPSFDGPYAAGPNVTNNNTYPSSSNGWYVFYPGAPDPIAPAGGHHSIGQETDAIRFGEQALQFAAEVNEPAAVSLAHVQLSKALQSLNKIKEASDHAESAVQSARDCNHLRRLGTGLIQFANLRRMLGFSKESIIILEEAVDIAAKLGTDDLTAAAHEELYLAYEQIGDFQQALTNHKLFFVSREKHKQEETRRRFEAIAMERGIEKQRLEVELMQRQLEFTEKHLSNSTLQFLAQTELLSELRDSLLQVLRKFPMPDGAAKELRERLKALPCKAVDWEKFEAQFKAAHPEFKRKLIEKYPEISPAEVRVCELLRMNLKNHEIARLTCLSERTVEDHRYQIRKKIGVKTGENVVDYLVKI